MTSVSAADFAFLIAESDSFDWSLAVSLVVGGAVGYFDAAGNCDMAIAIRTAVVEKGLWRIQAGAGIVADSDPDAEWLETQNKARALLAAAAMAEAGLDTRFD